MYKLLDEAYYEYLDSGASYQLAPYNHVHEEHNLVYASDLGKCPLAAALKRRNVPPKFPLTRAEDMSRLHLMRQGAKDAEPFQEAMCWKYPERAYAEVSLKSEVSRLSGRIDLMVRNGGMLSKANWHVIEIKRRDIPDWFAVMPKTSDLYQLMAYGQMLMDEIPMRRVGSRIEHLAHGADISRVFLHIVITNRYYWDLWTLYDNDDGTLTLHDQHDNPLPITVEWHDFDEEVRRHLRYLDGLDTACPMPDFINQDDYWLCGKWEEGKRPTKKRSGWLKRNCEHFCHTDEPGPWEVLQDEDGHRTVLYPETIGF